MISIVIPVFNMAHLIMDTIESIGGQSYKDVEIIVYDDCSSDDIEKIDFKKLGVRYKRGEKNVGVGGGFNNGIAMANGEYIMLMCADDVFTEHRFIEDVVHEFDNNKKIGHIGRYYFQFIDGDKNLTPVRAWRTNNILIQSNNPSGLAYRKKALKGCVASTKMFIEVSYLTSQVIKEWDYKILKYDAVAARVHESTSTQPAYWLKRRVSSPVRDWYCIGCEEITKDYASLVQIKNGFRLSAVFEEIWNFIDLRPANLFHPMFWFYAIVAVVTPRTLLRKLPRFYRKYLGPKLTERINRP